MPGGKIAVYTGILKITKNTHGLAAVMGHEIAHAVAKHSGERASRALVLNVGTQIADIASGGAISRTEGRWWAVPLGAVTGAAIGCQVDGG